MQKLVLVLFLIVPWLSLFFISKHSLKRFMPVAILASLIVTILFEVSYLYDWWNVIETLFPWGKITSVPLVYGVFIPGTIWIFHFTFDRGILVYVLTNIAIDGLYAFLILNVLMSIDIYELAKINNLGIFGLMTGISLVIYLYQLWQDGIMKKA